MTSILNDNTKKVPKKFDNNDTKTVQKVSKMMVLKSLREFLNVAKKVP